MLSATPQATAATDAVVFLVDVDNTLIDNDRFTADLRARLVHDFGAVDSERYWTVLNELRLQLGYVDYLEALQIFRSGREYDTRLLLIAQFMLEYPFAEHRYPHALDTIAHLRTLGRTVILSDGDIVFQPRKIQRAGLWDSVDGNVLVYVHKEKMLAAMRAAYPAGHYVFIDDKPQLLTTIKRLLGAVATTVFVRQGHYAAAAQTSAGAAGHDIIVDRIGDLRRFALAAFLPRALVRSAADASLMESL